MRFRRLFLFVCICCAYILALATRHVNADDWQPISPAELQMTSVSEAPGAPDRIRIAEFHGDERGAKISRGVSGPWRNTDTFEIALPAGYEVDDLPPPVNADYSFASYHSIAEVTGKT